MVVVAFTLSVYSGGGTLVSENGTDVVVPIIVPLVLATIAFAGLSAKCTAGSLFGERAAVSALTLLVLFTVITGFSIGILVLPIAALVAAAVVLTPAP